MTVQPPTPERRSFGRRWCALHAWIRFESGRRLDCTIANISERGAFIQGRFSALPVHFFLVIDAIGVEVPCELKRIDQSGAGVYFLEQIKLPDHMPRRMQHPLAAGGSGERKLA